MKREFIYIGLITLLILLVFGSNFEVKWKLPERVQIDSVKVVKEIPEKSGSFKSTQPKPIIINNYISDKKQYDKIIKSIEKKYNQKADSLTILRELLQATKIREYKEKFEDSLLTGTIDAKTKGTLESIDFKYKIKPRKISFYEKTTTKTVTPKLSLLLGGRLNTSTTFEQSSFELNAGFQDKKGNIYELGYDTNQQISIGFKKRLFVKY